MLRGGPLFFLLSAFVGAGLLLIVAQRGGSSAGGAHPSTAPAAARPTLRDGGDSKDYLMGGEEDAERRRPHGRRRKRVSVPVEVPNDGEFGRAVRVPHAPWHVRMARAVDNYARERATQSNGGIFLFKLDDIRALEKLPDLRFDIPHPVTVQVGCRVAYSHAQFDSVRWMCPENCTLRRAPPPGRPPLMGLPKKKGLRRPPHAGLNPFNESSVRAAMAAHRPADMIFDWDCCMTDKNTYREYDGQPWASSCQESEAHAARRWWKSNLHLEAPIRGSYRLDEDWPLTYTEWFQVPDGWTRADDHDGRLAAAAEIKAVELERDRAELGSTNDSEVEKLKLARDEKDRFREPRPREGAVRTWSDYMRPMFAPVDMSRKRSLRSNTTAGGGLVLFAHNNCGTKTKREVTAKGFVGLHARGKCLRNTPPIPVQAGENRDSAKVRAASEYKFLSSLENTASPFYATEKSFEAYLAGTIPIVWGHEWYKNFTPDAHSAIAVNEFDDIQALNKHLEELDNDDAKYLEYHAFRERGVTAEFVKVMFYSWMTVGCQLCEMAAHDYRSTKPATDTPRLDETRGRYWP